MIPTKQVLERASIPPATLSTWTTKYNLPFVKKGNRYQYPEDVIQVIEVIRSLKSQGDGDGTISRKLGYEESDDSHQESTIKGPISQNGEVHDIQSLKTLTTVIEESVNKNMSAVLDLSDKLNTAYHNIGSLEASLKHAEHQLRELPSSNSLLELKYESKLLESKIAEKEKNIDLLKKENQKMKDKQLKMSENWIFKLFFKKYI